MFAAASLFIFFFCFIHFTLRRIVCFSCGAPYNIKRIKSNRTEGGKAFGFSFFWFLLGRYKRQNKSLPHNWPLVVILLSTKFSVVRPSFPLFIWSNVCRCEANGWGHIYQIYTLRSTVHCLTQSLSKANCYSPMSDFKIRLAPLHDNSAIYPATYTHFSP